MKSQSRWLTLAVVSVALFLVVIDMTVLYTALPSLAQALHTTASEKLWILNAYSLVMAGLMPAMGALGDRLGHRKVFIGGMVLFGQASMIAALAPSANVLIAARALLAVGGAAMMPATRAVARASPLGRPPLVMRSTTSARVCRTPAATAVRRVASLPDTSTMWAAPDSSRCESSTATC